MDLGSLGDSAIKAWIQFNPSTTWANRVFEPYKGLPFGEWLHTTPPRRQRALTGPLDPSQESIWHKFQLFSGVESEQRTYEQVDSLIFSKLPLDVRMIIYEMVLGGMVLHVGSAHRRSRIYFDVCRRPEAIDVPDHQCHDLSLPRPSSAPREDYKEATGLLPLLVTCRRAYSEAIGILYSANTFDLHQHHAAFRLLRLMVPRQRLLSIRHFRMKMQIPHHPSINYRSRRDWNDLFAFFANEMGGLQSLHLALSILQPGQEEIKKTSDAEGTGWIKPMLLMAVEANRKRGCKVEVVTNGTIHDINQIFKSVARENTLASREKILELACASVHQRIRLSLEERG